MENPAHDISRISHCLDAIGRRRDRAAFDELFGMLSAPLASHVRRLGMPAEQVEDIVQDVMLRIWQRAENFSPGQGHAIGWIFRIARNACIDRLRQSGPYPEPEAQAPEQASQQPGADQLLDQKRRAHALQNAISGLPPEQAQLVRMAYFESLTHKDMAERLHLPLGTVKSRLRLAIAHLRQQMIPPGGQ